MLVALEQDVPERLQLVDPLDQATLIVQGRHRVRCDVEAPFAAPRVFLKGPIDHAVKLHQALIFAKVIFGFAKESVEIAVRPANADFPGSLKRVEDRNLI